MVVSLYSIAPLSAHIYSFLKGIFLAFSALRRPRQLRSPRPLIYSQTSSVRITSSDWGLTLSSCVPLIHGYVSSSTSIILC